MGQVVKYPGAQTDMKLYEGEEWKVVVDPHGQPFSFWIEDQPETDVSVIRSMEKAWSAAPHHFATLRRVGWLDQKGRVWTKIPPSAGFDGGSLTPLLIDARN